MGDLIERLRDNVPNLRAWNADEWADDQEEAADAIASLQAQLAEMRAAADDVNHERDAALGEVARLRERLEIGFYYKPSPDGDVFVKVADEEGITESYDGIACRDETIRLLDALVARAKVRLSDMREALETLITAVEWEVPAIRDGVDAERRLGILARHAREARASLSHKQEDAA